LIGLQIAPLAGAAPQAWRNGGGVTRELLTWPAASGEDWALRVSVAQIESDGPFSAFPDTDRWFAVVDGAGVALQFGARTHRLTPDSEPLCFDGGAAPRCQMLDGTTLDINLMVRRDAGRATLQRAFPETAWRSADEWRALYTSGPGRLQIEDRFVADLAAAALVCHPHAQGTAWSFHPTDAVTRGWWLSFQPIGDRPA
jgi:environmental stress-induced protein Ves